MCTSLYQCAQEARRHGQLYFAALVPEDRIREVFSEASAAWRGWIYTPAVTVWCFLSQVLSADHSCRETVARLNAFRTQRGQPPCAPQTGGYCVARDKLPEEACQRLLERSGEEISQATLPAWRWRGRRVRVVDGATITMPDTPENQSEYPQPNTQRPGCGFPILRVVVVFCLATGAALRLAVGRYAGKLTGEGSLFRSIASVLTPGDVLLADQYFSGWFDVALLATRGVDIVLRKYHTRRTDFRSGVRLGPEDHLVEWPQPPRPQWLDPVLFRELPPILLLREFRQRITVPGFRTRTVVVVTTLRDPAAFPKHQIAELFRQRWQAELHLRSLKTTLQMDHLRCLEPHRVRNELRMHLTAYNLLRSVMVAAATATGQPPHHISFQGTRQTLNEFLRSLLGTKRLDEWYAALLQSIAAHRVVNRPNRNEPRVRKRRPKSYPPMTKPRHLYLIQRDTGT